MFETLERLLNSVETPDFVEVVLLHKNILINAYNKVKKVRTLIPHADIDLDERFWVAAEILSWHGEELPRFRKVRINQSLHQKLMQHPGLENKLIEGNIIEENDFTELDAS